MLFAKIVGSWEIFVKSADQINNQLLFRRMVLILPEHSQRPYRYGMTLLCIGAMFNWLGLADNNAEPVRYIGVTLIAAGAMLICLAMCFWMKATHDPQVAALQVQ